MGVSPEGVVGGGVVVGAAVGDELELDGLAHEGGEIGLGAGPLDLGVVLGEDLPRGFVLIDDDDLEGDAV